jgi:ArsR family transcriptional regulator
MEPHLALEPKVRGSRVRERLEGLSEHSARSLADRFAALADPTRVRLLALLARWEGKVCVCDLVDAFDLAQPTISHHLRVLRTAGLTGCERRGLWSYHFVRRDALAELLGDLAGLTGSGVARTETEDKAEERQEGPG